MEGSDAMPRFVLKRDADDALSAEQVSKLEGVRVLDGLDEAVMLVEADAETIRRHSDSLAGWTIEEEMTYPAPPGPRIP